MMRLRAFKEGPPLSDGSSSPHEDKRSGKQHQRGQGDYRDPEDVTALCSCEQDWLLKIVSRPDSDHVFGLGEPVDSIEQQVPVSGKTKVRVSGEITVTENNHPRLDDGGCGISGKSHRRCGRDVDRSLAVF